jgi:glycosyltransferase involved in cell wall biosynthesis
MSALIAHNRAQQRELLDTVDALVVLTQWAVRAVTANGAPPEKVVCNRLGVSQTLPGRKPMPEQRPTTLPLSVGYIGRFDTIKGVHDLARAIADVPRTLPLRVEFRGPITSEAEHGVLRELRAIVGDDPRVTFAPAVTVPEVPQILAGYDILCCPAACLEGGPTVAIEAHAVGTPVIGTRIGGLAELITDGVNGKLVRPGHWRALADVLRALVADPRGTVDAWRRALPTVRTMDEVTANYLALYAGQR